MCALVISFAFIASAQTSAKAEFKFAEEKHDFGKVPQGIPVTVKFEFTNVGAEPLIISNVRSTCSCTVTDYPKIPIKAGDKAIIAITYNAAVVGTFNKAVIVSSNATLPTKYLTIVGEVVARGAPGPEK